MFSRNRAGIQGFLLFRGAKRIPAKRLFSKWLLFCFFALFGLKKFIRFLDSFKYREKKNWKKFYSRILKSLSFFFYYISAIENDKKWGGGGGKSFINFLFDFS